MSWAPNSKNAKILNDALSFVNSVPYFVSLRFIFYRWYQTTTASKLNYVNFKKLTSRARHNFWNGWHPATLPDDTRYSIIRGYPEPMVPAKPDRIKDLTNYIEIWFEARAMVHQFLYHTRNHYVTVVPFGGDPSISLKWEIAKRLESIYKKYDKPIIILYFGDCDSKGKLIPESAINHIRRWCSAPFTFIRCGLTLEQAKYYNLMPKPEDPTQFQWEALNDPQAKEIILNCLSKYYKKEDAT